MVYYSGHDLTLLEIMGTLGMPLQETPQYASHIEFELYKNKSAYSVKIRFNDKYIKLPIMNKNNSSSLKDFSNYIDAINKKYSN